MRSSWQGRIVQIHYDSLPHWIVDYGCYAVTLRCAGTLPESVRQKLTEITESLRTVEAASAEAESYRRQQFAILENTLDASAGFAPFDASIAEYMHAFLDSYQEGNLAFDAWVVMPNHLHLLTKPMVCHSKDCFLEAWRRFKQRSGVSLNRKLGRSGRFWQPHWYDRWVRDENEYRRWLNYFRANPVKGGLSAQGDDYPYLRIPRRRDELDD